MARYTESDPGFTYFEQREDLPYIFNTAKPTEFKYGFDLPTDVDFVVHLGKHCTIEDFQRTDALLTPDTDLFLGEGTGNQWLEFYFDEMLDGSTQAYKKCQELMKQYCPPGFLGHQLALLDTVFQKGIPYRILDPTVSHPLYKTIKKRFDTNNTSSIADQQIGIMDTAYGRDTWVLHNIKKIIDAKVPHKEGERRKVLIARGTHHINFLRALEYQTEYNPQKAHGSAVVASTVDLTFSDGSGLLTDFLEIIEK